MSNKTGGPLSQPVENKERKVLKNRVIPIGFKKNMAVAWWQ